MTIGIIFVIILPWVAMGFVIYGNYDDYRRKKKNPTFPDYVRKSIKDSPFSVMLIPILALGFINLNISQVKESERWDNCSEVDGYDDCEVECMEEGTFGELYDCGEFVIIDGEHCNYGPCKKRKND